MLSGLQGVPKKFLIEFRSLLNQPATGHCSACSACSDCSDSSDSSDSSAKIKKCYSLTHWLTMSPIELSWTAKKFNRPKNVGIFCLGLCEVTWSLGFTWIVQPGGTILILFFPMWTIFKLQFEFICREIVLQDLVSKLINSGWSGMGGLEKRGDRVERRRDVLKVRKSLKKKDLFVFFSVKVMMVIGKQNHFQVVPWDLMYFSPMLRG